MANPADDDGFLQRWSRRKATAQRDPLPGTGPAATADGAPQASTSRTKAPAAQNAPADQGTASTDRAPEIQGTSGDTPGQARSATAPVAPSKTLDDVALLNRESDFTPFVGRGVDPGVSNAAMKKLFTDPHFNVMDGLDIYIDDYGKPDPLPAGMLRQMVQARGLNLFSDDPEATSSTAPDASDASSAPAVAKTSTTPQDDASSPETPPNTPPHEDPALRLQPDDAAGREGPGPGAGQDAPRER